MVAAVLPAAVEVAPAGASMTLRRNPSLSRLVLRHMVIAYGAATKQACWSCLAVANYALIAVDA
eukprot:8124048-Lingulodinium_polyedra.AAC.1